MQKYPFQINTTILRLTADISELVGSMATLTEAARSPQLRRSNRIKTIYSSLAIEQNTLSLDQVTAVVSGKRVLAPPKDIAKVQNAFEIYDRLDELNPYSIDDLLTAHAVMVRGLRDDAGEFRSRPVGVVDSQGQILHFGTLPAYVPQLVTELLDWTEHDENPLLIKSTDASEGYGTRCCCQSGIRSLRGCRLSRSFTLGRARIIRQSTTPITPLTPPASSSLCCRRSKMRFWRLPFNR